MHGITAGRWPHLLIVHCVAQVVFKRRTQASMAVGQTLLSRMTR